MKYKKVLLFPALAVIAITSSSGCSLLGPSAQLKASAGALLAASESCVLDVRDKRIKYEQSKNCNSLGPLSRQYIEAGGGKPDTPLEVETSFERARVQAWMALALSASNGEANRVW